MSNISFEVKEGEILGLIGPNGSGKSTTFNCIAGMYAPTAGSVRFQGNEISGLTPAEICHRGIGRTYQIPRPFRKLSILENVAVAAYFGQEGKATRAKAWQQAKEALHLVQLPFEADASVNGLGAAGLKKLELARALATQPRLLLADESLGGLDEGEMHQAGAMLQQIRDDRGITIIWVEHIMGVLMRIVDRCLVLDHGELVAHGTPTDIARDARVIEVYLGTDAADAQHNATRVA